MASIELGSAPSNESCAPFGTDDYEQRARDGCRRFTTLLEQRFPVAEGIRARYVTHGNQCDGGCYFEVVVDFDDGDEQASAYAYNVARNVPETWLHHVATVLCHG